MQYENPLPVIDLGKYTIHENSESGIVVAYKHGKRVMEDVDLFQLLVDLHVKERSRRLFLPSSIPILVYILIFSFTKKKRSEFVFMNNIELLRFNMRKLLIRLRLPD